MSDIGELLPEGSFPGEEGAQGSRAGKVRAAVGWAFLALVAIGAGLFAYQVWFYAEAIDSGRIVDLSTVGYGASRFGVPSLSSESVDRDLLEIAGRPSFGSEENPLTVVVFVDFQCSYCRSEALIYRRMMNAYGDRARFVFRHYPIDVLHPEARQAAEAAECAHEQGKFWQFHDKLLLGDGQLTTDTLIRYGQEIGLDGLQFGTCIADRRHAETVDGDIEAGKIAGVSGTPTFFFNGQRVNGAIPEDVFELLMDQASVRP
ncbi:thioredoxin domain-containing protein [Candidatus Uhrbacteria bacterium]|nr:thioredoxin domain-containing protein [Candidatus Uhrbacteria bacterium]